MEAERIRQLERLFAVGTLTKGIAHELNNPLNAILMNAELGLLLLKRSEDPAQLNRILQTIVREAQQGGAITRRIPEFLQMQDYQPNGLCELNQIVLNARNLASSVLRHHGVKLTFQLDPALPRVLLNQIALEQAVAQLLVNAAQSDAQEITVATETGNDGVILHISDDGQGIPPDTVSRIFEPFFTTHPEQGKLGLGLSLVKRIIDDHQGTITLQDSAKGAHFIVWLPL